MRQLLHIFRKDVRHQWGYLAGYFALLVTFAIMDPQSWMGATARNAVAAGILVGLVKILIPLLWLLLIARLIHDECLVGDQQFWVTRPYSWGSLLGAKLLFVAACVVLPFVAMQWMLLLEAGLNPLTAIPGQLLTLLYFTLIVWLPFVAVAAVTRGIGSTFMALLGTVIAWALILTVFSGNLAQRTSPPQLWKIMGSLVAGVLVGVLVYQYATRDTVRSRIAIVAVVAMFMGWFCWFSNAGFVRPLNAMIRHHYPMDAGSGLRLVVDANAAADPNLEERGAPTKGVVSLEFPVRLEGLGSTERLRNESLMFTIDAPNFHSVTPWRDVILSNTGVVVLVPREMLNKVRGEKVDLHMALVAERLLPNAAQTVMAQERFRVPDGGECVLGDERGRGIDNMSCRYAFQGPPPTRVTGRVQAVPCGLAGPSQPGGGNIRSVGVGTKPDPVTEEPVGLGGAVCPGTALTFVSYRPAGEFRVEADVPGAILNAYIVR